MRRRRRRRRREEEAKKKKKKRRRRRSEEEEEEEEEVNVDIISPHCSFLSTRKECEIMCTCVHIVIMVKLCRNFFLIMAFQ